GGRLQLRHRGRRGGRGAGSRLRWPAVGPRERSRDRRLWSGLHRQPPERLLMRGRGAFALPRRRVRLDLLLGTLVVLAVGAAILVHQGAASSQRLASSSPDRAATAFARSYLGYLDGRLPARSLPDASA